MSRILEDLNPAQREAVTLPGGPCLVLAGAGSGKTRVLTHRVAWLVEEREVPPWEIVAVTFTNKAAREMRERVESLLGGPRAGDSFLGTFHAWCLRLLRREAERAGYASGFVIYDTPEQQAMVRRALHALDFPEADNPPRRVLAAISSAKNRLEGPEEFLARASRPETARAAEVYGVYQEMMLAANALDFDDLLAASVRLLESDPEVLDRYRERVRHLLVDEYQDTNHAQYRLIKALTGRHRNLMVVGDEDQSIFSWRGAEISNILDFERDFPDARVVRLEQNYRSTSRILSTALGVVSQNLRRKGKDLWTENSEGEPVALYRAADGSDEAAWVVGRIARRLREGGSIAEVAILYRTHAQSRLFEEELLRAGIPYIVLGGVRFYQRREVKDLLAYLTLAVNPDDPAAFLRVLNVPTRGIGKKTQAGLEGLARERRISLHAALELALKGEGGFPSRTVAALRGFHSLLRALRAGAGSRAPDRMVEEVLRLTQYLDSFDRDPPQERQARRENVDQLITAAGEAVARGESVEDFLAGVALQSDVDALKGEEKVPLMTLHSAKGLEYETVYLVGLEEGLLPHANSLRNQENLEEERRLCYVGMTRARKRLRLVTAATRRVRGQLRPALPSRFLDEVPDQCIEEEASPYLPSWGEGEVRDSPRGKAPAGGPTSGPPAASREEALAALERYFGEKGRKAASRARARLGAETPVHPRPASVPPRTRRGAARSFERGDKVRHERYGAGVVLSVEKVRGDQKLTVKFSAHGLKKFLASHAPLSHMLG